MNREAALENLEEVNRVLSALSVAHWIDCGTLLGAMREGDFLVHDTDIDIGVQTDQHEAIARAMFRAGFEKWMFFGTPEEGYEQSFIRNGVKVDIFYFYDLGDEVWQGSWDGRTLLRSVFPKNIVLPPEPFTFQGIETFVPNQPEEMLAARYGDWHEVKTEWDWTSDPLCLVKEEAWQSRLTSSPRPTASR